jgi:nucleotide-binding universal stress UspA family protein
MSESHADQAGPIVVGYDGSDHSGPALERAVEEAAGSGRRLVVVAVAAMPLEPEGPMPTGSLGEQVTALDLTAPPEVEAALAAARERIGAAGVDADYVWEAGEPAGALLREARDRGASLLVVGKGHHSFLGRWLGTDVAADVERDAGCPVLVVDR